MKIRSLLAAAVAMFILSGTVEAAKSKPIQGAISKVEQDSGKESGTITVKVTSKKKKGDATPATAEEKSFKITVSTKLETISGKKKDATTAPAKFSDLKEGGGVLITSDKEKGVESVKITKAKKKKKTAV